MESPNPGEPLPKPAPGDDPQPMPHPNPPIKAAAHLVQLHDKNERALTSNVVSFLTDGLKPGGACVVVSTAAHQHLFLREITLAGIDTESAMQDGRLTFLDAEATLSRIMIGGYPDGERFDRVVGTAIRAAKHSAGENELRAYGEMVGLLWKARQFPAAIRLEQLWNNLRTAVSFDLFCTYPIDVFDKEFDSGIVDALLCAHTHLLPTGVDSTLKSALDRAMDEVQGLSAMKRRNSSRKHVKKDWASLPELESTILWLRANVPDRAEEILARARTLFQAPA